MTKRESIGKLKKVLKGCLKQYDIEELTIISGYNPLYSGPVTQFFDNSNISIIDYRKDLLEKEVFSKATIGNKKLFIFLE